MTIGQLLERLKTLDPKAQVCVVESSGNKRYYPLADLWVYGDAGTDGFPAEVVLIGGVVVYAGGVPTPREEAEAL